MNVIWNHHEGMPEIMSEDIGVVLDCLNDHVCDLRLAQVERSGAGFVQQSIHGGKCLSGGERAGWKGSVGWQTVVETPRQKDGLVRLVDVRKSPAVERHTGGVPQAMRNPHGRPSRPGGRLRTKGLPHHFSVPGATKKSHACIFILPSAYSTTAYSPGSNGLA